MRLPVEIGENCFHYSSHLTRSTCLFCFPVKQVRQAVGKDFIIIYRLSMLDLVEGGSTWEEVVELAKRIELAGASIINTGK
jgi:2,4-dienoyl-CoA reductase-like NADH-dependent reductase (Old Yellow Enzyme family)